MSRKDVLVLLGITVVGGVIVWWVISSIESPPRLEFQQAEVFAKYTDIIVRSGSSQPFLILGYEYRITKVLREPPARIVPSPVVPDEEIEPPRPRPRPLLPWRRRAARPCSAEVGSPIPVDDVVFVPGPPRIGEWLRGRYEAVEVKAYEHDRLRISIVDEERAGAQYLIDVRIYYGNVKSPERCGLGNVRVNVIGAAGGTGVSPVQAHEPSHQYSVMSTGKMPVLPYAAHCGTRL